MKSTRSVRSLRSVHSTRSLKSGRVERRVEDVVQSFDNVLVHACAKFNCPYIINVKKELKQDDYYKTLKHADKSKPKRISLISDLASEKASKVSLTKSDDTSNLSAISEFEINTITVTMIYDNFNSLSEILITNRKEVPRILLKIIRLLAPYYKNLTRITISKCNINMNIIYELSQIIKESTIHDVCLDGSPMPLGDFTMLLKTTNLTTLSLCRCKLNDTACELIASMLHYSAPANNLLILNLSSNRITDTGAKFIANALRSNRHLRYLNLAGNNIYDEGAGCILDVLAEFPLTYDEIMKMRQKRLEYLTLKNELYAKYMSEYCNKSNDEMSLVSPHSASKRKRNKSNAKKEKDRLSNWTNEECLKVRAEMMAKEILGAFQGPFYPQTVKNVNGYYYSLGNETLQYLNLAYNNLSYESIKKLYRVVKYQNMHKIGNRGLTKVVVDGNNLPITCFEMERIIEILGRKIMRYSGRISDYIRRKGKGSIKLET